MKQDILPTVHHILRERYGELTLLSGQGIAKGERVAFHIDGKPVRAVIKTSSGGRISFGRRDEKWSGLDDSDFIVIVAPTSLHNEDHMVSMFDQQTMKTVFDANHAAQDKAGMAALPNWLAPFHEEGRGPRGVGDGFGDKALWSVPLTTPSVSPPSPKNRPVDATRPLTIAEAKLGLAKTFGVDPDAVEITIRG
jgi:hypothetical protein